jgi:tol-pal system protein YbgF
MNKRIVSLSFALLLAAVPAQAQLFGPSDDEKQHEADQDSQLTSLASQNQQLQARLQTLEDQTRSLTETLSQATGSNEDLRHQVDLLNQKINQQQKDFSYRLCMISAQQLGAGAGDQGLNCAAAGASGPAGAPATAPPPGPDGMQAGAPLPPVGAVPPPPQTAMNAPAPQAATNAPVQLRPPSPPGILGTLPEDAVAARPVANQFDAAMNLLAKAQYDEAKASFRAYADANPDDTELAPQAIYWVGNIDYIQHDYQGAMTAFAEQIKKYPKSARGPESMLKLGQSLLAMGRTQEGCTTLGAIKSKFPQAPQATLALATGTRKSSCGR